jgi:hypothetical protein
MLRDAQGTAAQLGNIRFSDIERRDLEVEQHARERLEMDPGEMLGEEIGGKGELRVWRICLRGCWWAKGLYRYRIARRGETCRG